MAGCFEVIALFVMEHDEEVKGHPILSFFKIAPTQTKVSSLCIRIFFNPLNSSSIRNYN
ncbi:MAG: hypothetical protein ACI815_002218 [Psychroserpens sp.]|jgi:hypothetical protein